MTLLSSLPVWAFEETVRRTEVDAGVHVPVLTRAPELKNFVVAEYPVEAARSGLEAQVKLQIVIAADGSVPDVKVTEPAGHGFDEAAVAAVKAFTFTPAEVDGVPSAIAVEYVYHFTLQVAADAGVDAGSGPTESDAGLMTGPMATLKGHMMARGSRSAISGALIACTNLEGVETASNKKGEFELTFPAGKCVVSAISADYQAFNTTETLEAGETRDVNYYARPKVVGYETVVRGQAEKKEVVTRTISRQELQKVPGTFGDPIRVVQNFPGVARAPFVSGQLIVRGANPGQTLTFFDGVEIPILFHLAGGPSVVNGEFLDRVDFFPGGFGARYGRAVGGVVDVVSRKGAADTFHGVAKVDLLDSSLFVETPLTDDISVAASVRRSYVDLLLPLVLPKDPQGGSLLILPAYWDYQVRLDGGGKRSQNNSRSQWTVFAFGSDDLLKVVATGGGRNRDVSVDVRTNFHRLMANWTYRTDTVQFKLTPYLGYDLAGISFGTTKVRADRWSQGLRQDLQIKASPWFTWRAGADIVNDVLLGQAELPFISGTQFVSFPGAEPKTEIQKISQEINTFNGALYTEGDFTFGPVTLTPGLRASHAYVSGQTLHAFDPRLWVRYQPFERTAFKGSIGLYTQPPDATDMQPPPLGTPTLQHERAFQSSLGVAQKITDSINVDVTGFYNRRYENVVSPGPTVVNADGSVTQQRFSNQGLGRAYGMELLLRHEPTKYFFGWVAYTLSRSEERRAGTTADYVITSFDQTHILTAVASLRLPYDFEVGARFRYVTGNPKSPLEHQADLYSADSNRYFAHFGPTRSARAKDFNQLDVRIDKYFVFDKWTLDVYLDVQNVYNQVNVEASFYDYRFRQQFDVPGVPILPVLGVKGSL